MIYNLNFLGYPNYKINILTQEIFRFKFSRSGLNEYKCDEIIKFKRDKNVTNKQLCKIFKLKIGLIQRLIKSNQKYWTKLTPVIRHKYLYIELYNNCEHKSFAIHRIICEIIHGPCPEGMECRHLDSNPLNNHPDNLCWGTHSENIQDKKKNGTYQYGEKNPMAKLKNKDIENIKYLNKFLTYPEIAKIYKVNKASICAICLNQKWNHLYD